MTSPRGYFIVQLASHFETYLAELANEIYYANEELLSINECQLTTREIFELGSIKRIRHHLKRKAVLKLIGNRTYPSIVKAFQDTLHIGIHSGQSPATQAEIHHFIEVRNIVVHNDGQASQPYFARMSNYDPAPPRMLQNVGDSLLVDFTWLFEVAEKLLGLADFVDAEVLKRWITTASPDWDSTDFEIYFLEDFLED